MSLEVWSDWRLESSTRVLSGSDDVEKNYAWALDRPVGLEVKRVEIETPGMDLSIWFTPRLRLRVFCSHLGAAPTMRTNWGVFLQVHHT